MRDYACTLLVALVGIGSSAFFQIGDGAIVRSNTNGGWSWVIWPQRGEYANTTYFVTETEAQTRLEFSTDRECVDDLALFTDGIEALVLSYANKAVHAPFFETMLLPLRNSNAVGQDAQLSGALKSYLASPALVARTDDDKTLVLATRRFNQPIDDQVSEQGHAHDPKPDR